MGLSPVKNQKTLDVVTEKIREEILSGKYSPGDKLPSEREFVDKLQVSRIVLREALRKLEAVGLLKVKHGIGMFIPEAGSIAVYDAFSSALQIQKSTMLEIMRANLIIEPAIAQLAATNRTPAHLEALNANMEKLKILIKKKIPAHHANIEFHSIVAEATQNRILILAMEIIAHSLRKAIDPIMKDWVYEDTGGLLWHSKIIKAIEEKKAKEAGKYMRGHIEELYKDLERLVKLDSSI